MNALPENSNSSDEEIAHLSVAFVFGSASYRAGGLFNSVRKTACRIAKSGHEVTAIALDDESLQDDLVAAWAPLVPRLMRSKGPNAIGYSPDMTRALVSKNYNIVHQHGIWQAFSRDVTLWGQRRGRPVVISPRGMLDPWALKKSKWKKRVASSLYERRNLRRAACLHALNSAEAAAIRAFGLENPIAVIPNGVSIPNLSVAHCRPTCLKNDHRKVLLFLGRLHQKKGILETIKAWHLLKLSAPEVTCQWRLVIAGWDDGNYGRVLISHAERLNLLDDVTFSGRVLGEDKDALLSNAEAFILASFSEGMPMAVLEAWSFRLPVFMTNACNLPEGFKTGAAIELSTDPQMICQTLKQSLNSPQLSDVGIRGRKLVEENFTWDKVVKELLQVYRWLTLGSERPNCVIDT
ncbi:MAG: glycosyltransferase [Cyanobacteria bacterium P01_F01_bin.33]